MRAWLRLILIALVSAAGLALGVVALAVPVQALVSRGTSSKANALPDINAPLSERSTIYAADGSILATLHATENRVPVTIDQVPAQVINAVLDTEDSRFWSHGGVDLKSTVRALASNVKSGAVAQGGSTITQQLVKNVILTPQKSLDRKVKEAVIADRLQTKYTKTQILEAYLNTVYFGNGAYGVQAAPELYFNKEVSQISAVQGAFLAGMIRDPLGYDPLLNPRDSKTRRDFVLDRMATQGHLTQAEADALKATPLPTTLTAPYQSSDTKDDYFVQQVEQILLNQSTTLGSTYSERYNALFNGGLKIYTTLNPDPPGGGRAEGGGRRTEEQAGLHRRPGVDRTVDRRGAGPGRRSRVRHLQVRPGDPGPASTRVRLQAVHPAGRYEAGYGPNDSVDGSSPCAIAFPGDRDLLKTPGAQRRRQLARKHQRHCRPRPTRSTARSSAWPTRWACRR